MTVAVATYEEMGRRAVAESEETLLLARCRSGDREAQEELVRRYQARTYRLAYNLLGNAEEALDACQEALLAMLRSLPSFRREASFHTWQRRITINVCLMQRRRLQLTTRVINSFAAGNAEKFLQSPDPEASALSREIQNAVREHLRRLPTEFRAVVALREMEGLSYDEIAAALQIPLGTVQSRLARGRKLLREALLADDRIPHSRKGR